jgi:hypothetical protein
MDYLAYMDHIGSYLPRYSRRDADVPLFSRLSLQNVSERGQIGKRGKKKKEKRRKIWRESLEKSGT